MQSFEETKGQKFEGYSSFKSSDMSKELETKIPVMAQNLEVTKHMLEDKVNIIKEPVREIKSVEIGLTRETIIIERKPVIVENDNKEASSSSSSNSLSHTESGSVGSRTKISIPLKKEVPVITKKSYVKEELIARKKPITDTKTITADVTHENIKYDNS